MPYEGKDCYLFELDSDKQRLDKYLSSNNPEYSRSSWQKHIKAGYVQVNATVETSTHAEVGATDTVTVAIPDAPDHSDKTLPILYEDDDIVVINKPVGVLTHPKNPLDTEFTVMTIAMRYWKGDATDEQRYGIVHRLDRDTSGVLVIARHNDSYESLKAQFSERSVEKAYTAIAHNQPKQDELVIDLPIARNPKKPGSFMVSQHGKQAITRLTVEEMSSEYTQVLLQPKTGRTHQLRVHMAYINCPIVGDRLYGKSDQRMYLHARRLTIGTMSGDTRTFEAPLPKSFTTLMQGAH